MIPDNDHRHRFRVRLLFGLFEADAGGALGISAVVLLFVLMGAGRWLGLW